MRPGKRGGAFCSYTVPSAHPYVLLNYTARRRDVLTLAHELGHGVHAALAAPQGVFHQSTPLTLAETASVFGEALVFGRLLEAAVDAGVAPRAAAPRRSRARSRPSSARRRCTASSSSSHTARREEGELSVERFARAVDARRRRSCSATPSR